MFERFTDRARKVMALANQEAQRFNHDYIVPEHVLLGLAKQGPGMAAEVLKEFGVELRTVRSSVEKLLQPGRLEVTAGKLPPDPSAKRVIELAIYEARALNHNYVGTEHLLLGLLHGQDCVAAHVLTDLGVQLDRARESVAKLVAAAMPPSTASAEDLAGSPGALWGDATLGHLLRFLDIYHSEMRNAVGAGQEDRVAELKVLLFDLEASINGFCERLQRT